MMHNANDSLERVLRLDVKPVNQRDDAREVVELLKTNRVAVLVDEAKRPIDILTLKDLDNVLERVRPSGARREAGDLFERKGKREVISVVVDDSLQNAVECILENGLATGVPAVDHDGKYVGFLFATDVHDALQRQVSAQKRALRYSADQLKRQYPNAGVQIDKWLGSS